MIARLLSAGLRPQWPICQDQTEEPATPLLGAAAAEQLISSTVLCCCAGTNRQYSARTMSEVTEYYNLNDDNYLLILLKAEKFGLLEESQPFSPPLESPEEPK
jgi:hypothetical protein